MQKIELAHSCKQFVAELSSPQCFLLQALGHYWGAASGSAAYNVE